MRRARRRAREMLGRRAAPLMALAVTLLATGAGCRTDDAGGAPEAPEVRSVALYMLSRGAGVPEEARRAYGEVEARLREAADRQAGITIQEEVLGLEGERRLCAVYPDVASARAAYERLAGLVAGVDLVNLRLEPCGERESGHSERG